MAARAAGIPCIDGVYSAFRDEDGLRAHCGARLAKFKIPREFIVIEALPRNDAGKVDRAALRRLTNPEER